MDDPKRWRSILVSIVSLQGFHLATSSSPQQHSSFKTFRVRKVHGPRQVWNERQRKLFELQLTFSKEGDPIQLPIYQLQVFPTPIPIDSDSAMSMDAALGDFFKQYFDAKYPNLEDDDDNNVTTSVPQFDSVLVETLDIRTITSESQRKTRRQLQRQGTELDIRTTLRFEDGVFPDYSQLKQDLQALFGDTGSFLSDYLPAYFTTALELVDTVNYLPGFTDPPTSSPTISASPTGSPSTPRNGTVSEINETSQANMKTDGGIDAVYPALICGVAVFILTALWLAHRRSKHRVADIDGDDYSAPIEHISVDYDGRQEALDIAKERQLEHQREQSRLEQFQNEEIARRLRASREQNSLSNQPWHHSANHVVQSERMEDGRTTIHITPETYGAEDYDYDDENVSEMTQVPARNTSSTSTPLMMDMTTLSDESVYYDQAPNTGIFCAAGNNGLFGGSGSKSAIKYQRHAPMPSTSNDLFDSASMESI